MNDREVDELIQDVLDGDDSPQLAERLAEALRDPSVRARHDVMAALFGRLRAVPLEDPADLRDRVMAALRARSAERAHDLPRGSHPRRALAVSLAAAAAGLAIVAAYFAWHPDTPVGDGVRGALAPLVPGPARMFTGELSAGGVTIRLRASREGEGLRIEVAAPPAAGSEVAIFFAADELTARATGFREDGAGRVVLPLGPAPARGTVALEPVGVARTPVGVRLTTPAGSAWTEIAVEPATPGP